jgi:hypothetical protein
MSRGLDDVLALAASTAGRVADSLAASSSLQFAGAGVNVTAPSSTAGALQQLLSLQSRDQAAPQVRVFIGDRELTDLVRTEITSSNRLTRRTVTAGAGTTF